jgi:protein SCO1/2
VNRIAIIILILLAISSCSSKKSDLAVPYYFTPDFTPFWGNPDTLTSEKIHHIRDWSFLNQEGKLISNNDFENKIYVANFFFTICPSICPNMMSNMDVLAEEFHNNDQIRIISHSVTPEIDSVPKLKEYAIKKEIETPQWHLVTGDKNEIYDLSRTSYFSEKEIGLNKDSTDFLHTEKFILVDQNQQIRGIYNGTLLLEVDRLIEDIWVLLDEK